MDYHIIMKRLFKLLFLTPMILFNSGCNQNTPDNPPEPPVVDPVPVDVVVISGQSNAVGCT